MFRGIKNQESALIYLISNFFWGEFDVLRILYLLYWGELVVLTLFVVGYI